MSVEKLTDMGIQFHAFRRVHAGRIEIPQVVLAFLDFELRRHSRLQQLQMCIRDSRPASQLLLRRPRPRRHDHLRLRQGHLRYGHRDHGHAVLGGIYPRHGHLWLSLIHI